MQPVAVRDAVPIHAGHIQTDQETRAFHGFLLGTKLFWSRRMYEKLHETYEGLMSDCDAPRTADAVETRMRETTLYPFFGWFERHLQRMKYSAPLGIVATIDAQREDLERLLEEAAADGRERGLLRLNPEARLPRYFTAVDFHQHPGGVAGDPLAGFGYEFDRTTTTPLHANEDDVHHRLAREVPSGAYGRILDLGCGIGKSTYPFKIKYPSAEVHGIDISAPCLKLAYLRSREMGLSIHYSQQDIERTDFPDGHFDLIHGTFLLHELPPPALRRAIEEAYRLLAPGGKLVFLDFHTPPGGLWGKFLHFGHARRNNEVFMRAFCETDVLALQREIGFSSAEMRPFDDGTGLVSDASVPAAWRFPWQLFIARKTDP